MIQIAAFFCTVLGMAVFSKRRFEQALPISLLFAMPILTFLAMGKALSRMDWIAWAVIGGVVLYAGFALAMKRISLPVLGKRFVENILTPGLVCFLIVGAFFLYATKHMTVWSHDDVVYWALEPKLLWVFDGLLNGSQMFDTNFGTYTPGMPVLQWWAMHALGEWQESMLYFVLFMAQVSFLLPLLDKLRWRHAWLIPGICVFLVAFPIFGNLLSYLYLGVDTALGLCFGYTLVAIYRYEKGDDLQFLPIVLGLCALVLIKQIGVVYALTAVLLLPWLTRDKIRKQVGKNLWLAVPFVLAAAWMFFCNLTGRSGVHTSALSTRLAELGQGIFAPPPGVEGLLPALWASLTQIYTGAMVLGTSAWVRIPKIFLLTLFCLIPLILNRFAPNRKLRVFSVYFVLLCVLIIFIQYAGFFTVFYHELPIYVFNEGKDSMVPLMERYLAPLIFAMAMLTICLLSDVFASKPKTLPAHTGKVITLAAALVFVLAINWSILLEVMLPANYANNESAEGMEVKMLTEHEWCTALEGEEDVTVLASLSLETDLYANLRYAFAPIDFVPASASYIQDAESLASVIEHQGITHVYFADEFDALYDIGGSLTEYEEMYPGTLYEVVQGEAGVELVEHY